MPESLFYDCPLKAAWMAKCFGMTFELYAEPKAIIESCLDETDGFEPTLGVKFHIHTESLSMLQPVHGDALYGRCGGEFLRVKNTPIFTGDITPTDAKQAILAGFVIIQRDGKPFHWPERETLP